MLDRDGLVKHSRKRRYKARGNGLSLPRRSNDLWCADYKDEFMLADRTYCYPLTVTDFASRYLLSCESLSSTLVAYAFTVFRRAFHEVDPFSWKRDPYGRRSPRCPSRTRHPLLRFASR